MRQRPLPVERSLAYVCVCAGGLDEPPDNVNPQRKVEHMNKDQIKGATKEAAGKVQKNVGDAVGSTEHQAKGLAKEAEGKVQKNVGDAKETIKDDHRKP